MKLFSRKQDEPKLSSQSQALIKEIVGLVETADADKHLVFAVRFNKAYKDDYFLLKDEITKAVNDTNTVCTTRNVTQMMESYIKYTKHDIEHKTKNRVIMTYLCNNQNEIDELFKAIGDNTALNVQLFEVG